jgi:hypothetical protein
MTEAQHAHLKLLSELPSRVHHWAGPKEGDRDEYLNSHREEIRRYQKSYYKENRDRILARRRQREGVRNPRS